MKINLLLELDYERDRDILFFLSNEKSVTSCIKNMSVKKEKKDIESVENKFDYIMGNAFGSELEIKEAIEAPASPVNTDDSINYLE